VLILFVSASILAAISGSSIPRLPAPLTITSGHPAAAFNATRKKYRVILANNGVTLKILPSQGSVGQPLQRLANPAFHADIGFVQVGETNDGTGSRLFSLGSVAYQPLMIFYRSAHARPTCSPAWLDSKLAVGAPARARGTSALMLLETNGISAGGATTLLDLDAEDAAKALLAGKVDAVFLMGDSASGQTMRTLLHSPGIPAFDFAQADAYTRRFGFLNSCNSPEVPSMLGRDVPAQNVNLIGPTVELLARDSLHPALFGFIAGSRQGGPWECHVAFNAGANSRRRSNTNSN